MEKQSAEDLSDNLSIDDKRELLAIPQERRNFRTTSNADPQINPSQINPAIQMAKSALPKCSGQAEDFRFYIRRLEARIQREWAPYVDPCSICLDMIDTLLDEKKLRVTEWFEESSQKNSFSWESFVEHFRRQFDDKEALQAA